jgi:nitroreductase
MIPQDVCDKILYAGSLAPSGHNAQPWRFEVGHDRIHVFNVPSGDQSLHNWRQKGSLMGIGACLENLAIAAGVLGYRAEITLFPQSRQPHCVASVSFEPGPIRDKHLFAAIPQRCTNRKPYRSTPLTEDQKVELLRTPREINGGEVTLFEDLPARRALGWIGALNERVLFETPSLHRWFFQHLRWTEQEERAHPVGLYLKTLELARPQEVMLKVYERALGRTLLNALGFPKVIAKDNAALNSSATIGMILMPDLADRACVLAGRLLERLWLKATSMGLSVQPLIGTIFILHRVRAGEADGISPAHTALLREAETVLEQTCQVKPARIAALFRIGLSDPPSARTSRYPLATLMGEERR